jgi:hypothetical protein
LKDLAARAQDVVAIVNTTIFSLLKQNANGFRVTTFDKCAADLARAPEIASFLLLPHQSGGGYGVAKWLSPGPGRIAQRAGNGSTLQVGLVWNGNIVHPNDELRSIAPEKLHPLFTVPDVSWHSLQVGPRAYYCPAAVLDRSGEIKDFIDTANIISDLDLVIGVDTGVTNLVGAIGAPVWVMVRHENDFRWGVGGDSTPWFPSARVFHQGNDHTWEPVIRRVSDALVEWKAKRDVVAQARVRGLT